MSTFAPPVSRDGFLYHDTFYADVGNLNRHKRASVAELTVLLRPELASNKKNNNSAVKDPVGHWYEAQLRHYGLPHTKDKNTAKVRLLSALNTGKLEVPRYLERLEDELKKEYVAANRKAKALVKKAELPVLEEGGGRSGSAGQKRKQSEATVDAATATSKKRKVTVTVGDIAVNIEEAVSNETRVKKQAVGKKTTTKEQKAAAKKPAGQKAESASSNKAATTNSGPTSAEYFQAAPAPKERPKQTARRSMPFNRSPLTSRPPADNTALPAPQQIPTPRRTKQTARRGTHTSVASNRHPIIDDPAPFTVHPSQPSSEKAPAKVKKEPTVKKEKPTIKNEELDDPVPPPSPRCLQVTGVYTITCPLVSEDWPSQASHLCLFLQVDQESDTIWGSYDLGPFTGVIRIPSTQVAPGVPVSFGWRNRERETGELSFASSNRGEIIISDGGRIQGAIFGLYGEALYFWGSRRPGPLRSGREAWQYKMEWDEFVEETYNRWR